MAPHDGILGANFDGGERGRTFYAPNPDTTFIFFGPEFGQATHVIGTKVDTSQAHGCVGYDGSATEVIFNKVYVVPREIDAGLIASAQEYFITLWNADYTTPADVTSISIINSDGIDLESETTPYQIARGWAVQDKLTVLADGPAVQESTIRYTINFLLYDVDVSGKRIEIFTFQPNWRGGLDLEVKFQTVVQRAEEFAEQRRPLMQFPKRVMKCQFTCAQRKQQLFLNRLKRLSLSILAVPLYVEPMTPTVDLETLTTVPVNEDLTKYWFANNLSEYVVILEKVETDALVKFGKLAELKEISAVNANSIDLLSPVFEDFKAGETVIFPAFVGIISSKSPKPVVAEAIDTTVEFKEIEVTTG